MATYLIDSDDQATETALAAYQTERREVQALAGQMYNAIARCKSGYANLERRLASGDLATLAEYHTAKEAPLADAIADLRTDMDAILSRMQAMEAAAPGLFPGVSPA